MDYLSIVAPTISRFGWPVCLFGKCGCLSSHGKGLRGGGRAFAHLGPKAPSMGPGSKAGPILLRML
jgi:hypothetical protein